MKPRLIPIPLFFVFSALACLALLVPAISSPGSPDHGRKPGPTSISQRDVPMIISRPGSYTLASDLVVTDPSVTAIFVATDDVTIDLGGFTIRGPEIGAVGAGSGIDVGVHHNIVVRNGTVRGFYDPAAACIHLPGTNNRIENVRVESCPQEAVFVGASSVVIDCQIANSVSGINTDDGTLVLNNTVFQAGNYCISTSGGGAGAVTVSGNNCRGAGRGILVLGSGNRIEGNVVTASGTAIDLTGSIDSYFGGNLLQGNATALAGDADDTDGGSIDPALSNIILP